MKRLMRLLVCLLLLGMASISQADIQSEPIITNPSSTDDLWQYFYRSGNVDISIYPNTDLFSFMGYLTGDGGAWWDDSFAGTGNSYTTHVFETYIMSSINQTVRIGLSGDDSHSIFLDEIYRDGGAYDVYSETYLTMAADTSYKVTFVLNNYSGDWHANFGLALIEDTGPVNVLFPDAANISMNATGDFLPASVPVPSTLLLLFSGLLGIAGVCKRR